MRRALEQSERRLRIAMEAAPVGMTVIGLDRRFVEVNPAMCRMVGDDRDRLLAPGVADILGVDDDRMDLRLRAAAIKCAIRSSHRSGTRADERSESTVTDAMVPVMRAAQAGGTASCSPVPIGQPPFNDDRRPTAASLKWSHDRGLANFTWTIDDPSILRYLVSIGMDGVYTRRPDIARKIVDASG